MSSYIERWDRWEPTTLLKVNLGISGFILIAHIGGAFASIAEASPPKPTLWSFLGLDDAVAIVVLASAITAMLRKAILWRTLRIHAVALSCLALGWFIWAITLASGDLPQEGFVWNPVLFAFLCAYPVYLIRRTYFADVLTTSSGARYSHVVVAAASLLLSGIIIYKVMNADV